MKMKEKNRGVCLSHWRKKCRRRNRRDYGDVDAAAGQLEVVRSAATAGVPQRNDFIHERGVVTRIRRKKS